MVIKGKKCQALIANFVYVIMGLIMLVFAYQMLSPMIPAFLSGKNTEIQILIMLITPFIFFFFLIYMFKTFMHGESEG